MKYQLLSERDMKAMDALKKFHGGAKKINDTIAFMKKFENRKKALKGTGFEPGPTKPVTPLVFLIIYHDSSVMNILINT